MKVVGLTGGIGSGKSSVAAQLKNLGARVFDADEEARKAVLRGTDCYQKVVAAFGEKIVGADGELNRSVLAEIVFKDKEALRVLEKIIHGYVWLQAEKFLEECRAVKAPVAILDTPLLIECGWHEKVDEVWLVALPEEQQIIRTMARSGMTAEAVKARIAAQMSLSEKKKYATVVIDNSGTPEETEKQIIAAWKEAVK